jgi:hypothetical protein
MVGVNKTSMEERTLSIRTGTPSMPRRAGMFKAFTLPEKTKLRSIV